MNLTSCVELSYQSGCSLTSSYIWFFSSACSSGSSFLHKQTYIYHLSTRFILVKYADRGLVYNGYPNMKFFNYLYWISLIIFFTYLYGIFPISRVLAGNFPRNSINGQFCMKIEFHMDEMNTKQTCYALIGPALIEIFSFLFMKQMTDYAKRQNYRGKSFSQFGGKHKRNLFTAAQTRNYLSLYTCFVIADTAFSISVRQYQQKLNRDIIFTLHFGLYVLLFDFLFGIFIPVKHLMMSNHSLPGLWFGRSALETNEFYVRQPGFVPRRSTDHVTKLHSGTTSKNSLLNRKRISRINSTHVFIHETIPSFDEIKPISVIKLKNCSQKPSDLSAVEI